MRRRSPYGFGMTLALALAACGDTPTDEPLLASPADARDLDPDPRVVHVALRAAPARLTIAGHDVDALAWTGQVPGPTIRARVGDTLVVDVTNALERPTTLHWHGMRVPFAVDGVTWMQDPIALGATRTLTFEATQAGTFWYHPHFDSEREVDRGLYGAIVIEDARDDDLPTGPVLVFDTWGESADAGPESPDAAHVHGGIDDRQRAWIVNGLDDPRLVARGGTWLRARLVNASNTGYLAIAGGSPVLIATDQGLGPAPSTPDTIVLAPGDRAEVLWPVGREGFDVVTHRYTLHGGPLVAGPTHPDPHAGADPDAATADPDLVRLFRVDVTSPRDAPTTLPALAALPAPEAPTPDPGATDVVWVLQGSERGWLINGESFPDVTIPTVALGSDVVIEVRNLSPTHHPFHLHGMAFEVLSQDGRAPVSRTLEDTIDLPIASRVRLLLHADNPGEWMAHCHILPHAHGMMTVLRVAEP
ncbi:MAG: multicopper oxidase family protein [Deltaproteobacteria bacterium]|nr:multicopper oxidase family protein [Deltaproteobacteria bacterium]